jgi:hypothetical protein
MRRMRIVRPFLLAGICGAVAVTSIVAASPASAWPYTPCAHAVWNTPGHGHYSPSYFKAQDQCNDLNLQVTGAAYFTGCWTNHYCAPAAVYCKPSINFNVLWKNFSVGDDADVYDNTSNGEDTRIVL